jgi:hypothetical protein
MEFAVTYFIVILFLYILLRHFLHINVHSHVPCAGCVKLHVSAKVTIIRLTLT